MDDQQRHEAGMRTRREVLGDEHVDRAIADTTDFTADFQDFITRVAWGDVWQRPGLERRTRSCLTIAMLAALGHHDELGHARQGRACEPGVTAEEIAEVLLQVAVYAGVPAANAAFRAAQPALLDAAPAARMAERRSGARSTDFVQSLERGLAVIRAFDAEHPDLSLSDVARATGLPRAAARRFLLTLVELGYVRTDGKLFALRPRILELGYAYLSSIALPDVAQPHLETLAAKVHESCSLSVLDNGEIIYVARVPPGGS